MRYRESQNRCTFSLLDSAPDIPTGLFAYASDRYEF
jgi:hypothetical protein